MPRCARPLPCLLLLLLLVQAASIVQGFNPQTWQAFKPPNVGSDVFLAKRNLATKSTTWQTLSGSPPLVIARGGSSGLFPDQTLIAYAVALNNSLSPIGLFCDLQLTKDGVGVCRTNIDLSNSTNIDVVYANRSNVYEVNGAPVKGYFSIDFTADELLPYVAATQATASRTSVYDALFPLLPPENVTSITGYSFLFWLNVEYANFFEQHKLDMISNVLSAMKTLPVDYLSSPEVAFLKSIKAGAPRSKTSLILQFLDKGTMEPTTNVTYGALLSNLTEIKSYASGILVPKEYIWPINSKTSYLESPTTLVQDAHKAGLEVYASGFVNDNGLPVYNYSFNPIREYSQFFPTTGPIVDGVLTDFPMTASEALACYGGSSQVAASKLETKGTNPLVISHNGASGDYPGCTLPAYQEALNSGANYIDCSIQMTKDGIPICRESPDLLANTDIGLKPDFSPSRSSTISEFQERSGIFTINMTMKEISTLKAIMFSPESGFGLVRNRAFDGVYGILTLSQFLSFAKNASNVGILIDIQNAFFMETVLNLDVVGAVISVFNSSGYEKTDRVLIQSEDSAVLKRFKQLTSYKLVYRIPSDEFSVPLSVIKQIKQLADTVTLPRGLVAGVATVFQQSFLANATSIVQDFHSQNISVFAYFLRNEFVALAFDYEADPTMEINTLVQFYKVDGLITDFPATSVAYLNNDCLNLKTEAGGFDYPMHLVIPGQLLTETVPPDPSVKPSPAPPPLDVSEPALPPAVITPIGLSPSTAPSANLLPNSTASPSKKPPAPGPSQSVGGSKLSCHVLLLIASIFASLCFSKLS